MHKIPTKIVNTGRAKGKPKDESAREKREIAHGARSPVVPLHHMPTGATVGVMEPRVPCTPAAGLPWRPTNRRQGAALRETGGLLEGWNTSPRDTSPRVQDLAVSRLPQGLADFPSPRGISGDAIKMPQRAGGIRATLLEDYASRDARGRGVKV
jgi:hypothetical protein